MSIFDSPIGIESIITEFRVISRFKHPSEHLIFEFNSFAYNFAMQLLAHAWHSFIFQINPYKSSIAVPTTHVYLFQHLIHIMNLDVVEFYASVDQVIKSLTLHRTTAHVDADEITTGTCQFDCTGCALKSWFSMPIRAQRTKMSGFMSEWMFMSEFMSES